MKRLSAIVIISIVSIAQLYSQDLKELERIIDTILLDEIENKQVLSDEKEERKQRESQIGDAKFEKKPKMKKDKKIKLLTISSPDEVLLRTGIQSYSDGFFESANKIFIELKINYPQSPYLDTATILNGKIYLKAKRFTEALREFNLIDKDSGEYPTALFYISNIHEREGNLINAIKYLNTLTSQFPEHEVADDALLKLGNLYLNANNGSQALEAGIRVIKYYPERETEDDAFFLIGKVFEKDRILKDFEVARQVYKIFIKKAIKERIPKFMNSPFRKRVEINLKYIEKTFFGLEN